MGSCGCKKEGDAIRRPPGKSYSSDEPNFRFHFYYGTGFGNSKSVGRAKCSSNIYYPTPLLASLFGHFMPRRPSFDREGEVYLVSDNDAYVNIVSNV